MESLLKLIVHLIAFLPARMREGTANCLGTLGARFDRKGRRILLANVAGIYALPGHSVFAKLFVGQVYRSQMLSLFNTLRELIRPGSLRLDGLDQFKAAVKTLEASGPVIACTAHLGAWELAGYCCNLASARGFVPLAKSQKFPGLTAFLDWMRMKFSSSVILVDRKSLVKDVLRALQSHFVGFVADQKPMARQGILVPFMGQPTEFVSGPARFAAQTKASIIALYVVRTGREHYRVLHEVVHSAADPLPTLESLTEHLAQSMERAIRLYPEQWAWNYKRWRLPFPPARE